jgi:hypothetical protein
MNLPIAHSEFWALAVIMIVVVSWLFYRYFAPKNWREWAGAGLVQAVIIALYAAMYGFPLLTYLSVRLLGLDRDNLNANLWSALLGMGETGMMIAVIIGYVLAFTGIGLFIEGWRELYHAPGPQAGRRGIIRRRQAPAIHRPVHRLVRRRRRALADDFLGHVVSGDRGRLHAAGVSGRTAHGRRIRRAISGLSTARADVLSSPARVAAIHRRFADGAWSVRAEDTTFQFPQDDHRRSQSVFASMHAHGQGTRDCDSTEAHK